MARYRKKPVVIEAVQWNGKQDTTAVFALFEGNSPGGFIGDDGELYIRTLEGIHHASFGDWIIRGVQGEVYPCKPDIFKQTYEPADG